MEQYFKIKFILNIIYLIIMLTLIIIFLIKNIDI